MHVGYILTGNFLKIAPVSKSVRYLSGLINLTDFPDLLTYLLTRSVFANILTNRIDYFVLLRTQMISLSKLLTILSFANLFKAVGVDSSFTSFPLLQQNRFLPLGFGIF